MTWRPRRRRAPGDEGHDDSDHIHLYRRRGGGCARHCDWKIPSAPRETRAMTRQPLLIGVLLTLLVEIV